MSGEFHKIRRLPPYVFEQVNRRKAELRAQGADIIDLGMGNPHAVLLVDSIDTAAAEGIKAVIQSGGSMRDAEVIEAADEHGIAMVFTGMRHFRH